MENVFVYGTLKRGHGNHVLLKDSEFLGPASTKDKYIMYSSGIPYVSKSMNLTRIIGELYNVDELVLNYLDMLENHPGWYKREKITIDYISNKGKVKSTDAWLYFNEQVPHLASVIESGVYGKEEKSILHEQKYKS
tara:strand:- start:1962 stop:2369 length:408 start_codon:yes stop_codon:yes gene_type:complete